MLDGVSGHSLAEVLVRDAELVGLRLADGVQHIHEQDGVGRKTFEQFSRWLVVLVELHDTVEVDLA